jgi:hypothetical protein
MSSQDSLYSLVHAEFNQAFGPPHNVLGGGEQWTLTPDRRFGIAIHVLLNGTPDRPGVWVFDPHDHKTGIVNTPIEEARQIGELITLIQQRMDFADGRPAAPAQES